MNKFTYFDKGSVRKLIETNSNTIIYIISENLIAAKEYEKRIREHLGLKIRIRNITNYPYSMDGLNFINSIVFLCGNWRLNRHASYFIDYFSKLAEKVIEVEEIATKIDLKGGEGNGERKTE